MRARYPRSLLCGGQAAIPALGHPGLAVVCHRGPWRWPCPWRGRWTALAAGPWSLCTLWSRWSLSFLLSTWKSIRRSPAAEGYSQGAMQPAVSCPECTVGTTRASGRCSFTMTKEGFAWMQSLRVSRAVEVVEHGSAQCGPLCGQAQLAEGLSCACGGPSW